tara:strand:- start:317 stop:532 length:216 start_codon:yes stop_codon:yes gene_type:complete
MRKLISSLRSHPKNKDIYGDAEEGQVDDLIEFVTILEMNDRNRFFKNPRRTKSTKGSIFHICIYKKNTSVV